MRPAPSADSTYSSGDICKTFAHSISLAISRSVEVCGAKPESVLFNASAIAPDFIVRSDGKEPPKE
ncbi:unannotated protein [freshwater metagenome]|uniref:Unannotated protein n=1 Tax=freshwater metagenome TaxID=449393 RepID=A0A6J6H5J8_9ZZZZ